MTLTDCQLTQTVRFLFYRHVSLPVFDNKFMAFDTNEYNIIMTYKTNNTKTNSKSFLRIAFTRLILQAHL